MARNAIRGNKTPGAVVISRRLEVGRLKPGEAFSRGGTKYIVSAVYPFGVLAARSKPTPLEKPIIRLPIDTLVEV